MKLCLWSIGKWKSQPCEALAQDYVQRLSHYFEGGLQLFKTEDKLLASLESSDFVVTCDEHGKLMTSRELAAFLEKKRDTATRRMIVIIGDAQGLSPALKERSNFTWSFSPLTFPHELALAVASEQLYRAATIIKGEKYHYG